MLRYKSLIFLFLSLLFISSCQDPDSQKSFTFAASGEFKPFSFVADDGQLTGFDIEVGEAIAKKLGLDPRPQKYKFAAIVEGVKSGRFDAAVASHTVTAERLEHVAFSTPYYYSGPELFTRPGESIKAHQIKGQEVAVSKGSTYEAQAKKLGAIVKVYDSDVTALMALSRGRHRAVITDFVTGAMAIKKGLKVEGVEILGRSEQAIAVAKDRPGLLNKINKALDQLKKEKVLQKISMKYFGRDITVAPQ